MSERQNDTGKFTISLRDNGLHSFWRGIRSYQRYDATGDAMLLKDAIMHLHHGAELLMKEILARHSPYLIFEDLRAASKKQKEADEKRIGIFFLDRPPRTVSFEQAISRVDAFVKPPELDEALRNNLNRLNHLRNQLEHYAIEADREEVTQVLDALRDPLFDLFEAQLGSIEQLRTPKVSRIWDGIRDSAKESARLEQEVFSLLQRFNGQKVPGRLLGVEGDSTLPGFAQVVTQYRLPDSGLVLDFLGVSEEARWAIEVKASLQNHTNVLERLASIGFAAEATPWLVVFSDLPQPIRWLARQLGILITGAREWQELKKLVAPD